MSLYEYRAKPLRVVDGDTLHADVDLGCDVHINLMLRLWGINAPEMSTPKGPPARAALIRKLIDVSTGALREVTILTVKDHKEKYGRYLATVVLDGVNLNEWMVENGHAVVYLP